MKHYIIGIFIVSCFSVTGYGQSSSLWLGAHAGADMGIILAIPPYEETITSKTGIAIGAELDYWFSDNFGISTGLAYVQKGAQENIIGEPYSDTYRYLQLPVLLKATFGSGAVKPYLFAGPEFGVKLSATSSGKFFGKDTTVDFPDSMMRNFNIGVFLGAGVSYAIAPETLVFLEAGYDYGVTNIYTHASASEVFTRDVRASLGILFRIE